MQQLDSTSQAFESPPRVIVRTKFVGFWVPTLAKFQVLAVLILIFLGGNVKSHEAGLSVPDWPTSYGYNMFTFPYQYWVGGIWYEHVHRLVASGVGALTVLLAVGVWVYQRRYKTLAFSMVVAVIVQGLLGGLTVILKLPAWTSSAHGMLAQGFLCMSVALAFLLHHEGRSFVSPESKVKSASILLLLALFVQLAFGAFVRHTESGLAVLDFPTVAGSYLPSVSPTTIAQLNEARVSAHLPPVDALQVLIHLLHRYWALSVLLGVGLVFSKIRLVTDASLRRYSKFLVLLAVIQVLLGISIILTHRVILPTSMHVVTGALMMALTMLIFMRSRGFSSSPRLST